MDLLKHVYNMSAILIHGTLQTTSPNSLMLIAMKRCDSLHHSNTIAAAINGLKLPVVVDSLLQGSPCGIIYRN